MKVVIKVCEGRLYHPMSCVVLEFVVGEIVGGSECAQYLSLNALNFPIEIGNRIEVAIYLWLPPVMRKRIVLMGKRDCQGGSVAVAPHF